MQHIPEYPKFSPIKKEFKAELYHWLNKIIDGISEFTFTGLYLFRNNYKYRLSWLPGHKLLIQGEKDNQKFYSLPMGFPDDKKLQRELVHHADFIKNLSEPHADAARVWLERLGYNICEDRNNFDYLYLREDLANLKGKKYHKKRNQVNAFISNYSYKTNPLTDDNISDAFQVLEDWRNGRNDDSDYEPSREALELQSFLELDGYMVYVDDRPVGYTMGEGISNNTTYIIHIEKALNQYRGIYQFINQAYAAVLPAHYHHINREQDLGDAGLRQAKMTYRPTGFIKKYRVCTMESINLPFHTLTQREKPAYATEGR